MIANILQAGRSLFSPSNLPNSDGFKFLGFDMDHKKYRCVVVKVGGLHKVDGMEFSKMIGWTNSLEVVK